MDELEKRAEDWAYLAERDRYIGSDRDGLAAAYLAGARAERERLAKRVADLHALLTSGREQLELNRAAMEFAISHLDSMRTYSLVEGACLAMEEALRKEKS